MILNDVADSARLIIKRAAPLDTEILGHRDLHTRDMVAIPERFQKRIGEAEEEHVVHRPFSQVMVDAEDRLLLEGAEQSLVELLRREEIVTERFFNDDASAVACIELWPVVPRRSRTTQAGSRDNAPAAALSPSSLRRD